MEDTLQMVGLGESFPVSLMCLILVIVFGVLTAKKYADQLSE